jgi:hypothetical protein
VRVAREQPGTLADCLLALFDKRHDEDDDEKAIDAQVAAFVLAEALIVLRHVATGRK